jgi:muramoyltetrapeptide carboxypeptidase
MKPFIKPDLLKKGDVVAMVAPSGVVDAGYIEKTTLIIESWGLRVKHGKNLLAVDNQFAGTDQQRLHDFQEALDDSDIKAIICARGGYGAIRIIDKIEWNKFWYKPKWVAGFSDITVFHSVLCNMHIQSLHCIMPINFKKYTADSVPVRLMQQALFEGKIEHTFKSHKLNRMGKIKSRILGGNLSILYALQGTPYELKNKSSVFFLEDVGEKIYHLDRMMQSLKLAGKLNSIGGLLVGALSEMTDGKKPFGKNPEEVIADVVEGTSFPVAYGFPAGHISNNYPLILGSEALLEVNEKKTSLRMI